MVAGDWLCGRFTAPRARPKKPAPVPSPFAAKSLDITITLAYRMSYEKEIERDDNVIGIRGEKTAVQSG